MPSRRAISSSSDSDGGLEIDALAAAAQQEPEPEPEKGSAENVEHVAGMQAGDFDEAWNDDDDYQEMSADCEDDVFKNLDVSIAKKTKELKDAGLSVEDYHPTVHFPNSHADVAGHVVVELGGDVQPQKVLIQFYVAGYIRIGEWASDAEGKEGLRAVNVMWSIHRLDKLTKQLSKALDFWNENGNHQPSEINAYLKDSRGSGYRSRFYAATMFGDYETCALYNTEGEPQAPPEFCCDWFYLAAEFNPSQCNAERKNLKGGRPPTDGKFHVSFVLAHTSSFLRV